MVLMVALLACTIDIGFICVEKNRCQNAADSASHAAACSLLDDRGNLGQAKQEAMKYAAMNMPHTKML